MKEAAMYRYKPLPNAEFRINSAQLLVRSLTTFLHENAPEIDQEHKNGILREALWKVTEAETGKSSSKDGSGKHGTRYCSESVWKSGNGNRVENLEHEHVVPIRNLIHALLKPSPQIDEVLRLTIGCTVFKGEHPRKEYNQDSLDGWSRYRAANIRVVDASKTLDPEIPFIVPETR